MNDILVHCKSFTVYFTLLSEITDGRHNEFNMLSTAYFWGAPTASWSNDQSTDIITENGDFSLRYTPSLLGRFESGIFTKISYDGNHLCYAIIFQDCHRMMMSGVVANLCDGLSIHYVNTYFTPPRLVPFVLKQDGYRWILFLFLRATF